MPSHATRAILADGPSRGRTFAIQPGQEQIAIEVEADPDRGIHVHERHHYVLEGLEQAPGGELVARFAFSFMERLGDDTTYANREGLEDDGLTTPGGVARRQGMRRFARRTPEFARRRFKRGIGHPQTVPADEDVSQRERFERTQVPKEVSTADLTGHPNHLRLDDGVAPQGNRDRVR